MVFSTLGKYQEYSEEYHEYTRGVTMMSVGDIISTVRSVQYTGGP